MSRAVNSRVGHLSCAALSIALASLPAGSLYAEGFERGTGHITYSYDGGFGAPSVGLPFGSPNDAPQWTSTPMLDWTYTFSGSGGNTSTAQLGFGTTVDHNSVIGYLAPYTGVSQSAPGGGNSPATLFLEEDMFGYSATVNPGCMTNIWGGYNIPLTATVTNGGYVAFALTIHFTGSASGNDGGGPVFFETLTDGWTVTTPGVDQQHTLYRTIDLPDLVPITDGFGDGSYNVWVDYEMTITVKNDDGPVAFSMPQGFNLSFQGVPAAAPEPSSVCLALGIVPFALLWWRRNRKAT